MQPKRLTELKRSLGFGKEDEARVQAFRKVALTEIANVARDVCDRAKGSDESRTWLRDPSRVRHIERLVVRYLTKLWAGSFDRAFVIEIEKIGVFLARIDLPVREVVRAAAIIRARFDELIDSIDQGRETSRAISRAIDLSLEVILGAYQQASIDRRTHSIQRAHAASSAALARAEHRYENMIENSRGFFVGLDARGRIRLVNREIERACGLSRDEITGRRFVDVLVAEDLRAAHTIALHEVFDAQGEIALPSTLPQSDGRLRDVVWHVAYAEPPGGDDVVMFAMGADLTEERAAAERTRQAEKLAAIGTLAAGLAHEIRNPLNGMMLHVSFLERTIRKEGGHEELLDGVHVVGEEIKRLAGFVSEFLEFARPEPMHVKQTSIRDVARSARDAVKAQAARAGVTLLLDVPRPEVSFDVDSGKIAQVLVALLRNAVEALASRGNGVVELRAKKLPREVVFEVEDDGPGILAESEAIFDAFYSTKEGGTGLGLAVSHRIVTDHRGTIDVSSKPGQTIFRVALPLDHRGESGE